MRYFKKRSVKKNIKMDTHSMIYFKSAKLHFFIKTQLNIHNSIIF